MPDLQLLIYCGYWFNMEDKKAHWENVFATKQETEVSWYQQQPQTSIQFFIDNEIPKSAKIIDIGGGDSYLIDNLLEMGYSNLFLLDISENAIKRIKSRLGSKAEKVTFIVSDIINFQPKTTFDVWHDRASFHFLTNENEIAHYRSLVVNSINENGFLFIGTFSENGPLKCSGLEITRYSEAKFQSIFGTDFNKINCFIENHQTPFSTIQNFIFCTFKKTRMINILVLCTGNSCRSQIAHGYLTHFTQDKNVKVYSAGVETHGVNPKAIAIMKEDGIDISQHTSNNVDEYFDIPFDYVITVCDNAKERCPFFPTKAIQLHYNFPDPAKAIGTEVVVLNEFRSVRELIKKYCHDFVAAMK